MRTSSVGLIRSAIVAVCLPIVGAAAQQGGDSPAPHVHRPADGGAPLLVHDHDHPVASSDSRAIERSRPMNGVDFREAPDASATRPAQAAHFDAFGPFVRTRFDESTLYVESDGVPHAPLEHPLMTGIRSWQQQVPLPQPYVGDDAWRIPLLSKLAAEPISAKTRLYRGAIALAVNGVPIFNALNNRGEDAHLAGELDEFGGHCGRGDDYHYHVAPLALQKVVGKSNPIAYALDGFALYGLFDPKSEAGSERSCPLGGTDPLDALNGHFGRAADGAPGVYHYHASESYPYVNGGLRGVVVVEDDQIVPQPSAVPVRPAQTPLRGARIVGFRRLPEGAFVLEIAWGGGVRRLTVRPIGATTFEFETVDADGSRSVRTYDRRTGTRRQNDRGGGDSRPDRGASSESGDRPSRGGRGARGDRPPRIGRTASAPTTRPSPTEAEPPPRPFDGFRLASAAIGADRRLPAKYTCDGLGVSPPLWWTAPPPGTISFALVMRHADRDGDMHVYWTVHDLPGELRRIDENGRVGRVGANTMNRRAEYAPPCSQGPGDKEYVVTLYALSRRPDFGRTTSPPTRVELLDAMRDAILATAELTFVYARPR